MENLDSKKKGNLTELQCMSAFMACGCGVSIPFGDNSKYDFIADVDGKLLKIQVKTSSERIDGSIKFSCRSTHVNSSGVKNVKYTSDDIDYFATYWNGICYIVPVTECSVEKTLRFKAPNSSQVQGITMAYHYQLDNQLTIIRSKE
jgi:hypothetical protein